MYRRKLGKSKVNNIHRFVSLKNTSTVLTESALEFDACYPLEYSRKVIHFESQPEGFEYIYENCVHRYTPDFLFHMGGGGKIYIEIKPEKIAKRKEFLERFKCMKQAVEEAGYQLWLWTEEYIRKQPYFNNLKILHRYRTGGQLTPEHRKIVRVVDASRQALSLQEYAVHSGMEEPQFLALAYDLLARSELATDLDTSVLGKNSVVGISHDDCPAIH